jgi:thiamine kinase-like enzyme
MRTSVGLLLDNLGEHPAVRAWSVLQRRSLEPTSIGVFKEWKGREKSGVYRLAGVGPGGVAVIAKRCPHRTASVERRIYEEFLPRLAVPTLEYYGSQDDPDGRTCWLFIEEASGDYYSPDDAEHRALAARWLAALHEAGRDDGWKTRLPDRGPQQYLELLRSCRLKLREHFDNPNLPPDGTSVLTSVCAQLDVVEAHWSELEATCQVLPHSMIHGDFVRKNLVVRPASDGPQLLVFDWEFAGWGAPAVDLAQHIGNVANPDLAVYGSSLHEWRPQNGLISRLAICGSFFRLVDAISWDSVALIAGPPELLVKPISILNTYLQRMAGVLSDAGWTA